MRLSERLKESDPLPEVFYDQAFDGGLRSRWGRRAGLRPEHVQYEDRRPGLHPGPDPGPGGGGGGDRAPGGAPSQGGGGFAGDRGFLPRSPGGGYPFRLPPGPDGGGERHGRHPHQPRKHRREGKRAEGGGGMPGERAPHPHRHQRGQPGKIPAGEIRRRHPGGHGGKRPGPCAPAERVRLRRDLPEPQVLRCGGHRGGQPPGGGADGLSPAHRGNGDRRRGTGGDQIRRGHRRPAAGGHRGYPAGLPHRRSGAGTGGGTQDPPGRRPAPG